MATGLRILRSEGTELSAALVRLDFIRGSIQPKLIMVLFRVTRNPRGGVVKSDRDTLRFCAEGRSERLL